MTIDTTAVQFAGIDIGSRTIKLLVVDGTGAVRETFLADTGFDPMATASELIETVSFDRIMPRVMAETCLNCLLTHRPSRRSRPMPGRLGRIS